MTVKRKIVDKMKTKPNSTQATRAKLTILSLVTVKKNNNKQKDEAFQKGGIQSGVRRFL